MPREQEVSVSNLIPFPFNRGKKPTNSTLKSNGQPKATKGEPIKDPADIRKMLNYFLENDQQRNYMIFALGISFALRASDLLSLKFRDLVDLRTERAKDYFYIRESKTRKANKVYINDFCKKVINDYVDTLEVYYPEAPFFLSGKRDQNGNLRAIDITTLNKILKKAAADCGLKEHVSSHSMRKTFGYQIMKMHENDQQVLYALQYMYNHSDLRTTYIYTGIEDDLASSIRNDMGQLLG